MKTALSFIIAGALVLSALQPAFAETTAPQTPTAKPEPATDAAKKAKAEACSKQATAKRLHGQAREEFRAKCKAN